MIRRPPRSTLFPYTTLFRSRDPRIALQRCIHPRVLDFVAQLFRAAGPVRGDGFRSAERNLGAGISVAHSRRFPAKKPRARRSEEHTSELQSRQYIVCRLLLE